MMDNKPTKMASEEIHQQNVETKIHELVEHLKHAIEDIRKKAHETFDKVTASSAKQPDPDQKEEVKQLNELEKEAVEDTTNLEEKYDQDLIKMKGGVEDMSRHGAPKAKSKL